MAELLLRVVDKVYLDQTENAMASKRGDVITVQEDGWPWGVEERRAPYWRIIKCPTVTVNQASVLLAKDITHVPRLRRAVGFDIDNPSIPTNAAAYLADDTRAAESFTLNLPTNTVTALFKVKP